jgi:SNF family Na+-dependent transporter
MDNYSLLLNSLYKPSSIYKEISSYRLSKQNIVEGAVLVCCISTLLSVAMGYFIMGSSEQMKELFSNESISFLFSPFATFFI